MFEISINRGDSKGFKFCRKLNNEIITERAEKVYFTVKTNSKSENILLQKTIQDMIFDNEGYYHFKLEPSDTDDFFYGSFPCDIEIFNESENYKKTTLGTLTIEKEVTFVGNEV